MVRAFIAALAAIAIANPLCCCAAALAASGIAHGAAPETPQRACCGTADLGLPSQEELPAVPCRCGGHERIAGNEQAVLQPPSTGQVPPLPFGPGQGEQVALPRPSWDSPDRWSLRELLFRDAAPPPPRVLFGIFRC